MEQYKHIYMCKNNEYDTFDEKLLSNMSDGIKRMNHMIDRMHKITRNRIGNFNKFFHT